MIKDESFGFTEELLSDTFDSSLNMISFEDINIGFAAIRRYDELNEKKKYEMSIYINPIFRKKGYGTTLLKELERSVKGDGIQQIKVENMLEHYDAKDFISKAGYDLWYSTNRMEYGGALFEDVRIDLIEYDENYYFAVNALSSEAFYEMRKENDIEPFSIPKSESEKENMLKSKDEYRLLIEHGTLIGVVKMTNGYVSLAAVDKKFRGKGYGTQLLKFATNRILNEGYDTSKLHVMDTNSDARKLYESMGYDLVTTVQVYRKMI